MAKLSKAAKKSRIRKAKRKKVEPVVIEDVIIEHAERVEVIRQSVLSFFVETNKRGLLLLYQRRN